MSVCSLGSIGAATLGSSLDLVIICLFYLQSLILRLYLLTRVRIKSPTDWFFIQNSIFFKSQDNNNLTITSQIMQNNCAVCQQETDKCCSLCRKIFYCSPEHQQVHWHMTHKFSCEGKQNTYEVHQQDFKIYGQSNVKSAYQTVKNNEEDAKMFVQHFGERLTLRKKVLTKYINARQSNSPPLLNKQLIRQAQQLSALSKKVTQSYRAGLSQTLQQQYGLITNGFIVKTDQLLDKILLARCYQLSFMAKELKQILLYLNNQVEPFPQGISSQFAPTYKKLLIGIIDISQSANLDKASQKMYSNFIKLVQKFQGIWEQGYAYFHMGLWYAKKTYYQKALKCFTYAYELILAHKSSREAADNAAVFKGDALYNIALCRYSSNEHEKAYQCMQQSYRLRALGLGKSSMQVSDCLLMMGRWSLKQKKYENCLQLAMECLRIRKANPSFTKQLQEINILIIQMYQEIRKEKQQNQVAGASKNVKYYEKLLQNEEALRGQDEKKKESFTKRLLQSQKEFVTFKLVITPELADTFTSQQWSKVGDLIELVDTKMEKQEAIRLILQSQFSLGLNEEQRNTFIKLNKIT